MSRTLLLGALLILAFIGIADAWYLADTALKGVAPACDIKVLSGCAQVAASPYSKLFGIPLGVYGTVFYSAVFGVGAMLWARPLRMVYLMLYRLGIFGFLASMVFVLIQAFLIKSFCIYCILSAVIAVAIFALSRSLFVRFAPAKAAVVG